MEHRYFAYLPRVSMPELVAQIRKAVREEVRAELRKEADRKSFAAASEWMTLRQVCEHLKQGRTWVYERRQERRRAKTDAERDAAFAPEYLHGVGEGQVRFRRTEIDAWRKANQPR